jgi:hypothetical protein
MPDASPSLLRRMARSSQRVERLCRESTSGASKDSGRRPDSIPIHQHHDNGNRRHLPHETTLPYFFGEYDQSAHRETLTSVQKANCRDRLSLLENPWRESANNPPLICVSPPFEYPDDFQRLRIAMPALPLRLMVSRMGMELQETEKRL